MKPRLAIAIILVAAVFAGSSLYGQASRVAEEQFKAAQNKEQVEGDLKGAIEQYRKLAQGSDRAVAAKALLRMAASYEKLGDSNAQKSYERVQRDFPDQTESAATARTRLTALQSPVPQVGQVSRQIGSLDWADVWAPLSADGRYVSVVDTEAGGVALHDLRKNTTRRFTNSAADGWAEFSAVSPDGRQVAYTVEGRDGSGGYDLRVLQTNGSDAVKPRIVYRSRGDVYHADGYLELFGWTPDSKSVLVTLRLKDDDLGYQIAFISIADGSIRVLKNLPLNRGGWQWTSLSPDGALAYDDAEGPGPRDIFVLTADGKETRVVEHPADDSFPVWSPDGASLVFVSNRTGSPSLWTVPIQEGRARGPAELVKSDIGNSRPLGMLKSGALVYSSQRSVSNVYIAQLDSKLTATSPTLATNRWVNSTSRPVWSPDGQQLAYQSSEGIVIRSMKSGEDRVVPPSGIRAVSRVRWFPDGQSVLVTSPDPRSGQMGLYRVDITTGAPELLLAERHTSFDLSPDGKVIFFVAGGNRGSTKVMRFDIESRRQTELTTGGGLSIAVSADGARVAYTTGSRLEVIPATGGEPREVSPLVKNTPQDGLAWTPDHRFLLFLKRPPYQSKQSLWRVPVAGGEPESMGISMGSIRAPRVHPDGRQIAFDVMINSTVILTLENFLPKKR